MGVYPSTSRTDKAIPPTPSCCPALRQGRGLEPAGPGQSWRASFALARRRNRTARSCCNTFGDGIARHDDAGDRRLRNVLVLAGLQTVIAFAGSNLAHGVHQFLMTVDSCCEVDGPFTILRTDREVSDGLAVALEGDPRLALDHGHGRFAGFGAFRHGSTILLAGCER